MPSTRTYKENMATKALGRLGKYGNKTAERIAGKRR